MNAGILTSGYAPPQLPNALLGRSTPIPLPQTARAYDADALAWINAVERADGQPLEREVCVAVDEFVRGCKADGIWNAIKACCIMCGARTLAGALVPLVGPAPTNQNFVSSDYRRTIGLAGNASNKGLNSNRASSEEPQNDCHLSVWITRQPSFPRAIGTNLALIGAGTGTAGGTTHIRYNLNGTSFRLEFRNRAGGGATFDTGVVSPAGFVGMSRSSAERISRRAMRSEAIVAQTSGTIVQPNYGIFGAINSGSSVGAWTDATMSFYSIGTSLPLALLESRVSNLMSAIQSALASWPTAYYADADVNAYITAVEMADGQTLEPAVRDAINAFIVGCKQDGTWDSLKTSCILMGARTLAGALTPLQGALPAAVNFVTADYDRKTGLLGNGTNKSIFTGRNHAEDGQNDVHGYVYVTQAMNVATGLAAYFGAVNGGRLIQYRTDTGAEEINCNSFVSVLGATQSTGGRGISRNNAASFTDFAWGVATTRTIASTAITSGAIAVFQRGDNVRYSNARMAFYSFGAAVNLSLLNTRVADLSTALGAAIA